MFCKNCGNQIKDGVRFCPQCGKETGISMTQEEIKEPKEAAGFSRGSRTPLRKNRHYVTTYNVGHFGVLIGCVIQAVALFMPNYKMCIRDSPGIALRQNRSLAHWSVVY